MCRESNPLHPNYNEEVIKRSQQVAPLQKKTSKHSSLLFLLDLQSLKLLGFQAFFCFQSLPLVSYYRPSGQKFRRCFFGRRLKQKMKRLLGFLLPALSSEDKPEGIYIKLECPSCTAMHSFYFLCVYGRTTQRQRKRKKKEKIPPPSRIQTHSPLSTSRVLYRFALHLE